MVPATIRRGHKSVFAFECPHTDMSAPPARNAIGEFDLRIAGRQAGNSVFRWQTGFSPCAIVQGGEHRGAFEAWWLAPIARFPGSWCGRLRLGTSFAAALLGIVSYVSETTTASAPSQRVIIREACREDGSLAREGRRAGATGAAPVEVIDVPAKRQFVKDCFART